MPVLSDDLLDLLWLEVENELPERPVDAHPWGPRGHRQRVPDRVVFDRLMRLLCSGYTSFESVAERGVVSATTLRRRFHEWIDAGVFNRVRDTVLRSYDHAIGLQLDHVSIDGFKTSAPRGGDNSGPNPTDRRKMGRNLINVVDGAGVPLLVLLGAANQNDHLFVTDALDVLEERFPDLDRHPTIHADAGFDVGAIRTDLRRRRYPYDIVCSFGDVTHRRSVEARLAKRNPGAQAQERWHVERTNKWFRDFGRIARCPERAWAAVRAWINLAQAVIILRRLLGEAWDRYRWDGRPARNPHPKRRAQERTDRQYWSGQRKRRDRLWK